MTDGDQTKVCPLCAETIKAAAKVCPHCRHWQKKWSLQNPHVVTTIWVVTMFAAIIGFSVFVDRLLGPKEFFENYRDQITVVSSQFSQRMVGSNLLLTVVGTVTNRSAVAWKNVGVEAQFMDKSGKLFDVFVVDADYYHSSVVVLPHGEAAFKIECKSARPASDCETYKLAVRWAKDAYTWP